MHCFFNFFVNRVLFHILIICGKHLSRTRTIYYIMERITKKKNEGTSDAYKIDGDEIDADSLFYIFFGNLEQHNRTIRL